jgi:hypothetical protein
VIGTDVNLVALYDLAGSGFDGRYIDNTAICQVMSASGIPEPPTNWIVVSGNWSDANCWSAGEPSGGLGASITNGGTSTISQTGRACSLLTLGASPGQSGTVRMTGGVLNTGIAYVGYKGIGAFIQSDGSHYVRDTLSIATESNSVGSYSLQGGSLYAGEIVVGGSATAKGGAGTFTVSGGGAEVDGRLIIWDGSAVHLSEGTLVDSDPNHPYLDVDNSGTLYIEDGVYCLGRVQGIGDTPTGTIVVEGNATLWVESIKQESLIVEAGGMVHFAAEDYDLYMSLALENQSLVPEPGAVSVLAMGGLLLGRRRRKA